MSNGKNQAKKMVSKLCPIPPATPDYWPNIAKKELKKIHEKAMALKSCARTRPLEKKDPPELVFDERVPKKTRQEIQKATTDHMEKFGKIQHSDEGPPIAGDRAYDTINYFMKTFWKKIDEH